MNIAPRFTRCPLARAATGLALAFALAVSLALALGLPAAVPAAFAAPGAHGPNGEHLDERSTAAPGQPRPRLEAQSELFELVARLEAGALTILVDRYETNEPVLGAQLEVESGSLKASATFRPEPGDYAVTDAGLLAALSEPGEHALVFTVLAGDDTDLLDGTLVTVAAQALADDHGDDHELERALWIAGGTVGLALIGGIALRRMRPDRERGSATATVRGQA